MCICEFYLYFKLLLNIMILAKKTPTILLQH